MSGTTKKKKTAKSIDHKDPDGNAVTPKTTTTRPKTTKTQQSKTQKTIQNTNKNTKNTKNSNITKNTKNSNITKNNKNTKNKSLSNKRSNNKNKLTKQNAIKLQFPEGGIKASPSKSKNSIPYLKEIILVVILILCILMFLGFFGVGGVFCGVFGMLTKGMAGRYLGVIFPIALFLFAVYVAYNWTESEFIIKTIGILLIFISFCSAFELIGSDLNQISHIDIWKDSINSPGGFIGLIYAKTMIPLIGKIWALILTFVLMLIGVIMATRKSFFSFFRNVSDKAYAGTTDEEFNNENDIMKKREERNKRRAVERQLQQAQYTKDEANLNLPPLKRRNDDSLSSGHKSERSSIMEQREARKAKAELDSRAGVELTGGDISKPQTESKTNSQTAAPDFHVFETKRQTNITDNNEYADINSHFDVPGNAHKRPIYGVERDTTFSKEQPADTEAVEMNMNHQGIVVKSKQTTNARRLSFESDIDYEFGYLNDMMTETAKDVPAPPVIRPVRKAKKVETNAENSYEENKIRAMKEERTLEELNNLDVDNYTASGYISPSDEFAAKNDIPLQKATWDDFGQEQEESDDPTVSINDIPVNDDLEDPESDKMEKSFADEQEFDSSSDDGYKSIKADTAFATEDDSDYMDEDQYSTNEEPVLYGKGHITTDENVGIKRVVTASGKIIESRQNFYGDEQQPGKSGSKLYHAGTNEDHSLSKDRNADSSNKQSKPVVKTEKRLSKKRYVLPDVDLLGSFSYSGSGNKPDIYTDPVGLKLIDTLESFGVEVELKDINKGPTVTRYEIEPKKGVKVSKIVSLADDIKLNLAAADIRIEAPIPGKSAIGIEVPNKETSVVKLRDLIDSKEFTNSKSKLSFAAGMDISGKTIITDIAKMPHLLIAGSTGSGKSVCINTLILSILYKAKPDEVELIMVDPKVVELSIYNDIPHIKHNNHKVVTDPRLAQGALNWAVEEMDERYEKFAQLRVRDISGYNAKIKEKKETEGLDLDTLPQIVIIIDELADLMMVASNEVEDYIVRLAQKARAAGIHLVIATQRPSVNVITGLIKANVPSRIAFAVSSGVDSRTIIDMNGAEKLLGRGDMLFYPSGYPKPIRVQGAFVTDEEVAAVADFWREQAVINGDAEGDADSESKSIDFSQYTSSSGQTSSSQNASQIQTSSAADNSLDDLFIQAGRFIIEKDKASIGMLQRMFRIGFNRAARIMDQLAEAGVVGEEEGTKPRRILMSAEEFDNYIEENGL